ncbi:cystatin C (amyloid angiopathy and cerebral hemorrhage) [Carassius auratus]|uniref:Cystatin C (Amyloid angiopathy and cerebral hemorrhage) n=1 Tax=Carassius auratus TaxID=7957 RepID=A0A6P6L6R0_CARAU|nr:cystatin-like [Carassius auratus]XP_052427924.1 cystatin C (amyloid angiopathy and cerebral hemorrhage) [Carassius gibelio]
MYFKMIVPFLAVILAVASAGLTGAPMDADMNDEGVKSALQFAVAQYNRQSNDAFVRQVSEVIKVQRQVVSGMKYIFTVKMGRTSCRKGGAETLCAVHEDPSFARATECKIKVWSQPWRNFIKVLENTCLA